MRGLDPRTHLQETMGCRVKPNNGGTVDNSRNTATDIHGSERYINPPGTSGLLALNGMGQ
jgi:hypothetical protein